MKHAVIFFALIGFSGLAWAQTWTRQDSAAQTRTLYAVAFLDTNCGWAVGEWGTIRKTVDGGETWNGHTTGTENAEYSVCFADTMHGWSISAAGWARRTVNGGATWTQMNTGTSEWLRDIVFLDTLRGWMVGQGGTIKKSVNGGTTWTTQTTGSWRNINSVDFVDTLHGWAVGSGIIFRTVNGGSTWTNQTNLNWLAFWAVDFVDTLRGWAVGDDGRIWATVNGGTSWTQQTSGTAADLRCVSFADENNGWIVGDGGVIIHTENGGVNWSPQASGTTVNLQGVTFADAGHGWAVGASGVILHYHVESQSLPPAPFDLASPVSGTVVTTSSVNLSWFHSANPDGPAPLYEVWMDTLSGFSTMWQAATGIPDSMLTVSALLDDYHYYWTVRALDDNTDGTWAGDSFMFITSYQADPPGPFGLSFPADSAVLHAFPVALDWGNAIDPDFGSVVHYDVWLDTLPTLATAWPIADSIAAGFLSVSSGFLEDRWYFWTVRATDVNTSGTWANDTLCFLWDAESSANDPQSLMVSEFYLAQNYPNPFNPLTNIRFGLPKESFTSISVYDLLGRRIADVFFGRLQAGTHEVAWDGSAFPSGMYLLRLQANDGTLLCKMLLTK